MKGTVLPIKIGQLGMIPQRLDERIRRAEKRRTCKPQHHEDRPEYGVLKIVDGDYVMTETERPVT